MNKKIVIASLLSLSALVAPSVHANSGTSDVMNQDLEIRWEVDENGNQLSEKEIDAIYNNLDKKDKIIEDSKTTDTEGNGADNKITFTN